MYKINPKKHYRIWFSSNPDSFLNIENQLRFIDMRVKNPDAIISFIYSSKLLSKKALLDLKNFCKKHKIKPINFERDLFGKTENDSLLLDLCKDELEK